MLYKLPFFPEIDCSALEDNYDVQATLGDTPLRLDLNFENRSIAPEKLDAFKALLQNLPKRIAHAKNLLDISFAEAGAAKDYIDFQLESLHPEELDVLLKDADPTVSKPDQLRSILKIKRIGCYPEEESHYAIFDFTVDEDLTDYLMVLKFRRDGALEEVTMES